MLLEKPWLFKAVGAAKAKLETFADVVDLYEKRGLVDASRGYRYWVEMLKRDLGPASLERLPDCLVAYIDHRRTHASEWTGAPLSNASCNRIFQTVKAACTHAVRCGQLKENPLGWLQRFQEVPRDRWLTPDEADRLYQTLEVEAPHLYPIFHFAMQVPCRRSELVLSQVGHVHLAEQAVWVPNGTTKNNIGLWKPIPADMRDYFRELPRDTRSTFFRRDRYGVARTLGDFKRSWHRALRLAGIEDFHFHDTRHIAATRMINAGTPREVVNQIAGWKTDMLRRYYHRDGMAALSLIHWATPFITNFLPKAA